MPSDTDPLGKDEIFEVLSNSRRRRLIYLLHSAGGDGDLRDFARQIATAEQEAPADESEYKRLYISLYQTHVPKLEEYGIVEYDSDTKHITLTSRVDELINIFREEDDRSPWWQYYAGLAVLSTAFLLVYWAMFPPTVAVSAVVAFVPVVLLGILAIIHYLRSRYPDTTVIRRMVS